MFILISNALTLKRDLSVLFARVVAIVFSLACVSCIYILTILSLKKSVALYDGLFHTSSFTQSMHLFFILISGIILLFTGFHPRKIYVKQYSSIYNLIICKFNYIQCKILNNISEQYTLIEYLLIVIFIICGGVFLISTGDSAFLFLFILIFLVELIIASVFKPNILFFFYMHFLVIVIKDYITSGLIDYYKNFTKLKLLFLISASIFFRLIWLVSASKIIPYFGIHQINMSLIIILSFSFLLISIVVLKLYFKQEINTINLIIAIILNIALLYIFWSSVIFIFNMNISVQFRNLLVLLDSNSILITNISIQFRNLLVLFDSNSILITNISVQFRNFLVLLESNYILVMDMFNINDLGLSTLSCNSPQPNGSEGQPGGSGGQPGGSGGPGGGGGPSGCEVENHSDDNSRKRKFLDLILNPTDDTSEKLQGQPKPVNDTSGKLQEKPKLANDTSEQTNSAQSNKKVKVTIWHNEKWGVNSIIKPNLGPGQHVIDIKASWASYKGKIFPIITDANQPDCTILQKYIKKSMLVHVQGDTNTIWIKKMCITDPFNKVAPVPNQLDGDFIDFYRSKGVTSGLHMFIPRDMNPQLGTNHIFRTKNMPVAFSRQAPSICAFIPMNAFHDNAEVEFLCNSVKKTKNIT